MGRQELAIISSPKLLEIGKLYSNLHFLFSNATHYRIVHSKDPVPHLPPCIHHSTNETCKQGDSYPHHLMSEVFYSSNMHVKNATSNEGKFDFINCPIYLFYLYDFQIFLKVVCR